MKAKLEKLLAEFSELAEADSALPSARRIPRGAARRVPAVGVLARSRALKRRKNS